MQGEKTSVIFTNIATKVSCPVYLPLQVAVLSAVWRPYWLLRAYRRSLSVST